MAGTLKDYLSAATADYSTTQFDVEPQRVMVEEGEFRQKTIEFDDVSVGVLTRSTTPIFYLHLDWPVLSSADANTIYRYWRS